MSLSNWKLFTTTWNVEEASIVEKCFAVAPRFNSGSFGDPGNSYSWLGNVEALFYHIKLHNLSLKGLVNIL